VSTREILFVFAVGFAVGAVLAAVTVVFFFLKWRLKELGLTLVSQLLMAGVAIAALQITRRALDRLNLENHRYWQLAVAVEAGIWLLTALLLSARARSK
jgi:hypothetical protein